MQAFLKTLKFALVRTQPAMLLLVGLHLNAQQYSSLDVKAQPNHAAVERADHPSGEIKPPQQTPEYVVGEGDILRINVWKETEISQSVAVRPDGKISLPLVDEIRVAGLTPRQIQELITEKLKKVLTNPQVTVTVTEVRSKMVYITGEVGKPGAYPVVAPTNVLQLIARAGGLTQFANHKRIYILRAGDQKNPLHFSYEEVVKGKNSEQNITLQPGDTVVVR